MSAVTPDRIAELSEFHSAPPRPLTVDDITAAIRHLRGIEIEECAEIVRAVSCKLAAEQKGFMRYGHSVVCQKEIAVEQLDLCSDLVSEAAGMLSDNRQMEFAE